MKVFGNVQNVKIYKETVFKTNWKIFDINKMKSLFVCNCFLVTYCKVVQREEKRKKLRQLIDNN